MPFRKFKPWRIYGRFNTRMFKLLLRKKKRTHRLPLYIDPEIASSDIIVENPLSEDFFQQFNSNNVSFNYPQHLKIPEVKDDPLYKTTKSYIFDSEIPLTDGIDEACVIIKAPGYKSFPNHFFKNPLIDDIFTDDFEEEVKNSIMHGERYDPTFEKLPRKFDPIIFWTYQRLVYGTPVKMRNNIIMRDLYRKVLFASFCKDKLLLSDLRCDFDAYLSSYLPESFSGFDLPLVLRQQPHLITQTDKPLKLLAQLNEIESTRSLNVPNIYPISPIVDLKLTNLYNDVPIIPRNLFKNLYINTIFYSKTPNQKYPWTTEQNAADAIINCFGAALAQATRNGNLEFVDENSMVLKNPIVTKSVQLINGKLDLVAVQLNTLNLSQSNNNDIKNLVWVEKAAHLYKPKHYYENMETVTDFNFETFKKFAAFLLYR